MGGVYDNPLYEKVMEIFTILEKRGMQKNVFYFKLQRAVDMYLKV
jgi:hypothetical protein